MTGSRAERNARYGVELSGGSNLTVADSFLVKNDVGVVVNNGATGVTIAGNEFRDQVRQAVAVRDADARANVTRNTIAGGDTGIYVRDAHADITGNTLTDISNHAVTLLGDVKDTAVEGNAIAGYGSTAIWKEKSAAANWGRRPPGVGPGLPWSGWWTPSCGRLTFIWLVLGGLLVTAAAKGRRSRHVFRSPYADRVPLTSLTRGIIALEDVRPPH